MELPLTIPAVVRRAAERYGDIEGVVDGDVRLSFAELAAEVDAAARAMIASGVEPGDKVAIWAPNIWEWAVTALGCHSVGGIVIPLNTRFKGNEAGYVIGVAGATRLFTVTDFLDTNYVDLLAGAPGFGGDRRDGRPARHRARRVHRRGTSSSHAATRSTPQRPMRAPMRCSPTTCATSSSRRAPRAGRRERCCSTRRASVRTTRGPTSSASAPVTATSS